MNKLFFIGDDTKTKSSGFYDSDDDKVLKAKLDYYSNSPEPTKLQSEKNVINEMEKFDDLNELIKMVQQFIPESFKLSNELLFLVLYTNG